MSEGRNLTDRKPSIADLFVGTDADPMGIEVPDFFNRCVPRSNPTDGYDDRFFEQTFQHIKRVNEVDPSEFDRIWWDVYKSFEFGLFKSDAVRPENVSMDEFTKGTGKIVGHGFFIYEVMFMNIGRLWWPFAIYEDPMQAFCEAMVSPMFRGRGLHLVCKYAARSIDTGRRYIPFEDHPPDETAPARSEG